MRTFHSFFPFVIVLAGASQARADGLLPSGKAIEEVVDHHIDARLKEQGVRPAPPANDAAFLRRVTLDLVGRIPTAAEMRDYVASTDPDKRIKLVDRLMASPGFVRHQATEFDAMLMDGTKASIREYLLKAFQEKRPWDQIFRELVLAAGTGPKGRGPEEFLRHRLKDVDRLTNDVSVLFFGVNISCAKCHDHPLVMDWKQDHFYGMKSFFSRTYEAGGRVAERGSGVVRFKTNKGKGPERQARMMFLTGKVIDDPGAREPAPPEKGKKRKGKRKADTKVPPPPAPKFSARHALVDVALQPDQRGFFARSIVNRVWARMYGMGLVSPVDQMHSENAPSHPELLEWLARDTVEHGYDLRRLIRGLVLSRAYARSSRWEGQGDPPNPRLFAVARVRPLTPMQLAGSLRLATTDPVSLNNGKDPKERDKRIEQQVESGRGIASLIEQPHDDFQISVGEALLFSNNDRIERELLADGGDRLVGRLKQMKDDRELIDLAVRNVLSRPATADEYRLLEAYLKQRASRRVEACRQMVWALMTSAEFRFNY